MEEHQTLATPALEEDYKIAKSLTHVSVTFMLIIQDIIKNEKKSAQHIKDLELVAQQLARLENISGEKSEYLIIIKQMTEHWHKLSVETSLSKIKDFHVQYLSEITPSHERLAHRATKLQLEGIHQIISTWVVENNLQLNRTRVLISCAKGPREKLIEKQYMQWLYSQQGIGDWENNIICVEMLPEQLTTVTTHELITFLKKQQFNEQIGKIILGDHNAMNKDILGEYAPKVLPTLCPIKAVSNRISACKDALFSHLLNNQLKSKSQPNMDNIKICPFNPG
ncbi:hypothetical protein ACFORL_07005 [Legionella dresdenensis]|uniref:Uncharacterized protein n=1 Tax=Legionella dresdenensis TaxID=450200 RepID=A0ABV8CEQ7_9GAMM